MKWDESKFRNTVQSLERRIDANEYAAGFWQRYWELNHAQRWRVVETPTLSYRRAGGAVAGRPVQTYFPVEPVEPIRVRILTGRSDLLQTGCAVVAPARLTTGRLLLL